MPTTLTSAVTVAERAGRAAPEDLLAKRAATAGVPIAAGPDVEAVEEVVGGVACLTVSVTRPRATVLHLHGGGYRMGNPAVYSSFAGRLARATGARVVLPDYRLAPEHPFPAGLCDAAAVYDAVAAEPSGPLVLSGDSAGGGLATSLTASAVRVGAPTPAGLVLMSPWLDLRCASPTYSSRATTDVFFPPASAREAAEAYLQDHPADDPLASPLLAGVPGFPPTHVLASLDEVLLADATTLVTALAEERIPVTLEARPGVAHGWPLTMPGHPETERAFAGIGRFVQEITAATAGREGEHHE